MLVVKGLDVLHQQAIARGAEQTGSPLLAVGTFILTALGAIFLVIAAGKQALSSMGQLPSMTSYDSRGAAETAWDEATPETRAKVNAMMADANAQMEKAE
jgi:hypothetical protein